MERSLNISCVDPANPTKNGTVKQRMPSSHIPASIQKEMQAWMIQKLDNLSTHNTNGVCTDKYLEFAVALDRTGSGLWSLIGCIINFA